MGLLSISIIVLGLTCLGIFMAVVLVMILTWPHTTHISQGGTIDQPSLPDQSPPNQLIDEVCDMAQSGNKIEAIKLYRQTTGAGLKEAKDAVEALNCDEEG